MTLCRKCCLTCHIRKVIVVPCLLKAWQNVSQSNSNTSPHTDTGKKEKAYRNNLSQTISILVSKKQSHTLSRFTGRSLISWTLFPVCSVAYFKRRLFLLKQSGDFFSSFFSVVLAGESQDQCQGGLLNLCFRLPFFKMMPLRNCWLACILKK